MNILKYIFCIILEMSIVASIVGVITLIIKNILKSKISPKWLNLIWIVFLITLINPIRFQSSFSIYNFINYQNFIIRDEQEFLINEASDKHTNNESYVNGNSNNSQKNDYILKNNNRIPLIVKKKIINNTINILTYIYIIAVSVGFIKNLAINKKIYSRIENINNNITNNERLNVILENLKNKIGLKQNVNIIIQDIVKVPAVYGIFNNRLLVTEDIYGMLDEEIELIFLHELLHIKNKDTVLNVVIQILKIIYWFNPIINYLLNNVKKEIELVNDDNVIDNLEKNKRNLYCKTLLKMAILPNNKYCSTLNIVSRANDLEDRIKMIKGKENFLKNKFLIISLIAIIVLGITVCFATTKITNTEDLQQCLDDNSISNIIVNPLEGEIKVTAKYEKRVHPITKQEKIHCGVDIKAENGEKILAMANGVVEYTGYDAKNGNAIELRHINLETGEVYYSYYAHLSKIDVNVGENINAGEKIGEAGSTGLATGPHLHFEIRNAEKNTINPNTMLDL